MSIGQSLEVHLGYRFGIFIDGITYAAFTECRLPSLTVETLPIKEGGQNTYIHKLPVRVDAGTLTLRHGITRSHELLSWYLQVLNGDIENATRDMLLVVFDITRAPLMICGFRRAYPIKWVGPQLQSSSNAVAIEELELAYHGFEVA